MISTSYEVEILTPCFCAGANQAEAEIRVPSIRGQLRWWFRALGGSYDQEKEVLGGVHGDGGAKASAVVVRISNYRRGPEWQPFPVSPNAPESYVWYYASISSEKTRWTKKGNVPPRSVFTLHIICRRKLDEALARSLNEAVESFLRFGGLGLRTTRGLGALHCATHTVDEAALGLLRDNGFRVRLVEGSFNDMRAALAEAGRLLKEEFRSRHKSTTESALGWSSGKDRQASAVRFRVVRMGDQQLRLLIYEAPHERVLAENHSLII